MGSMSVLNTYVNQNAKKKFYVVRKRTRQQKLKQRKPGTKLILNVHRSCRKKAISYKQRVMMVKLLQSNLCLSVILYKLKLITNSYEYLLAFREETKPLEE